MTRRFSVVLTALLAFALTWWLAGYFQQAMPVVELEPPAMETVADATVAGPRPLEPAGRLNFLVLGLDEPLAEERVGRSDVIIVATVDPVLNTAAAIWLPRDTRVAIPGVAQPEKLGHAHSYGGAELARETVEAWLGITIDHTISVDMPGFAAIIDALGGVEMYVDEETAEALRIPAGQRRMPGRHALRFVQQRPEGDVERIGRQQELASVLKDQLMRRMTFAQQFRLLRAIYDHASWDIPFYQLPRLAQQLRQLSGGDIQLEMIPGRGRFLADVDGLWYWLPDEEETQTLIQRTFFSAPAEESRSWRIGITASPQHGELAESLSAALTGWGYDAQLVNMEAPEDDTERIHGLAWRESPGLTMVQGGPDFAAAGLKADDGQPSPQVLLLARLLLEEFDVEARWLQLAPGLLGSSWDEEGVKVWVWEHGTGEELGQVVEAGEASGQEYQEHYDLLLLVAGSE